MKNILKSVLFIKQSNLIRMKYHQKLNLKSPIYKYSNNNTSRTPTKSPLKPSPNPVELFQKVCCPNCKYAFKIIKQQIIKQHPLQITNAITKKNKTKQKKSMQVQTQNEPIITVHNSPTKTQKSSKRLSRSPGLHANQNIDNYKMDRVSEAVHDENTKNKNLRDSGYKFKPLSVSPNDKIGKSNNLLKTLDPKILSSDSLKVQQTFNFRNDFQLRTLEQEKFGFSLSDQMQERQNYLESPKQSSEKLSETHRRHTHRQPLRLEPEEEEVENRNRSLTGVDYFQRKDMNFNKKQKMQSSFQQIGVSTQKECCQSISNSALTSFILQTLIKSDENHQTIIELQTFCKTISQQVQVPSYCKMLALSQ